MSPSSVTVLVVVMLTVYTDARQCGDMAGIKQTVAGIRTELATLQADMAVRDATLANLTNHIQVLETKQAMIHSETGIIQCGNTNSWPNHHKDVSVKFEHAFAATPAIKVGVVEIDSEEHKNLRYKGTITEADATGFKVRCATWSDTKLWRFSVSWIAVSA